MNWYSRTVDRIIKVIGYIVAVLLTVTLVLVILQVFTRYVLRNPIPWTEQGSRWLFVWMVMLGLPIMFNSGNTMSFDLILNSFPKGVTKGMSLFFRIFTLAFCVFWCYSGILYVAAHGAKISSGIRLPMTCVYVAQPVGSALISLVMIKQIIELIFPKGGHKG